MSENKRRYLPVGAVMKFEAREGEKSYPFISLDIGELKEFVKVLTKFGKEHLSGLDQDEIREGVKKGKIPRISLSLFEPNENAPDFIKNNIALKLED